MTRRSRPLDAFSLIELMVVLAILSIILGMSAILLRRENRDAQVKGAAEELAAVFRQARNLAMHEQAAYAVVFHIQNAPGTSGAVLNNWSGGHSYRILGPHRLGRGGNPMAIPMPGAMRDNQNNFYQANFPDFLENLREAWVGPAHVLPARKVRFLALGDTDEGPRDTKLGWSSSLGNQTFYAATGDTTYPRPWFGVYDTASQRLFPWGGYDPSRNHSGFFYEGSDGDVTGCLQPVDRSYNNDFNRNGSYTDKDINSDGDLDDPREREVAFPISRQGEPRPLVNADWMDAGVLFLPTGEAQFMEWNRGRRAYDDAQVSATSANGNGVRDRSKVGKTTTAYGGAFNDDRDVIGEVAHFERHTGGWFITLGPDSQRDGDRFPDARTALDSILPAYRVHIGRSGVARVLRVQRQGDGYLAGHTVWPPTPATWQVATKASSNSIWRRCRIGYLHVDTGGTSFSLTPAGKPIVDHVTERMLTDRIWWFDE